MNDEACDASELREEIERHQKRQRGRYPEELRQSVVRYAVEGLRGGQRLSRIAREVGVVEMTIRSWLNKQRSVRKTEPWARVRVMTEQKQKSKLYALRGPGGWHVEGLSLDDIAQLMREMAR